MTLTEIRQALESLEASPRQVLGQNFLHDGNLARGIVDALEPDASDTVVEIGPGLGALTRLLAGVAGRLVLLEKDAKMVAWLKQTIGPQGVELFHGDALDFDLRRLWGFGPVKIIGNLPYYVSTPLIAKFASVASPASMLVLTLQQEVAARLAAGVGDDDYGAMSVCVQRRWKVRFLRKLPPSVFHPAPKVSSAVVRLDLRPVAEVPPLDDALFESLVRRGFGERRKQLRNRLPELREKWDKVCGLLEVPPTVRAEDLSLPQWEKLVQFADPTPAQRGNELFDEVTADDVVIGPKPRNIIHVNKLRHRAVHMLLFNASGELFLQRRSPWKDLNPAVWDSSAAGHVDAGETYAVAAGRELQEELGVQGVVLTKIGKLDCTAETSWEFVEVFRGLCEGPYRLARLEVETGAYFSLEMITRWLAARPQDFSPMFRRIFPAFVVRSCAEA